MNVLYSFPHRLGAGQICYTAWQQASHLAAYTNSMVVLCGSLEQELPPNVKVIETLKLGPLRVPYRLLGRNNACLLHDYLTARYIRANANRIDLVHGWPMASRLSLATAREAGIATVIERPNAHTAFAFDVVEQECRRIGFSLPPRHEHRPNARTLRTEEAEYRLADHLLCPSEFVGQTFLERGFARKTLLLHHYGYDETRFRPSDRNSSSKDYPTVVFAGVAAPRKGLHIALEAWRGSHICGTGRFLICGSFVPNYAEFLGTLLSLPGVELLGHRRDLPDIFGRADALVLSSLEEGSALVTYEARASGCVLLVSNATGAVARHGEDALIHTVGDVETLRTHFDLMIDDPIRFDRLRRASIDASAGLTWKCSGRRLFECYSAALDARKGRTIA